MANLKSQGCGIFLLGTASPQVYTEIGQVTSISGPDGSASEIDVTSLSSQAKEYILGLPDEGSVTLSTIVDHATTANQHSALWSARSSQSLRTFQIRLSDSPQTTLTFAAFVSGFSHSLGVDDAVKADISLRISGAVTIA